MADADSTPDALDPGWLSRFGELFRGYERAHGRFTEQAQADSGKVTGRAQTVARPVTPEILTAHLTGGGAGLGVIMLTDNNHCWFGAIDHDKPTPTAEQLAAAVDRAKLPLVTCRSKSGGTHLYVFLTEPVPARELRARLEEWGSLLGLARTTEVFPKQSHRHSDVDVGSWINLPYYRHAGTQRYAVNTAGRPLTLPQFLDWAETRRVSPKALAAVATQHPTDLFYEGPPCLQVLAAQGGFVEGSRNTGMAGVAVYLRKRYPDDWQERIDAYNTKMAGLPSRELVELVRSHSKKAYNYQCKLAPLAEHCNRRRCLARQHGVGDAYQPDAGTIQLSNLTRYTSIYAGEEPLWRLEVGGRPVMVTNSQLYSKDEFNRACLAQVNLIPVHVSPAKWLQVLNEAIQSADVVPLPEEATQRGQLWLWIQEFLRRSARGTTRDDLFNGAIWLEGGGAYFRSQDLFRWLDSRRVTYPSQGAVWMMLKDRQGVNGSWTVEGATLSWWRLPYSDLTDDPAGSPRPDPSAADDVF